MARKYFTTEVPAYAKAPEYGVATRSFTLALVALCPYGIGVWLFSALGDSVLYLMILVVLGLLVASSCFAILAIAQAQRNERPRLVRGWSIAALTLNFLHVTVVLSFVFWLVSNVYAEAV